MTDVAITGIGLITPLGVGREKTWSALRAGRSGIGLVRFDDRQWCAGAVRDFAPPGERSVDRSIAFALHAGAEALSDAGLNAGEFGGARSAVVISSSKGGVQAFVQAHEELLQSGRLGDGSLFHRDFPPAAPATALGERWRVSGPVVAIASACAAGAHALIEGGNLIREGLADVVLAGGTEAALHPLILASYENLNVLAQADGDPAACCKPFDARRSGFAPAEGCGIVVLEEAGRAQGRGTHIYAYLAAGVRASDAHHLIHLSEDGASLARAIVLALRQAALAPKDIDYINAHGTGTRQNDVVETRALKRALGEAAWRVPISSTKGAIGHLLGAAGSVEAAICALAIRDGFVPPTLNLERPDPECDLDYVPGVGRAVCVRRAMSLSLGFGGQIGVVILSKELSPGRCAG